jgi:hypothetical protein
MSTTSRVAGAVAAGYALGRFKIVFPVGPLPAR